MTGTRDDLTDEQRLEHERYIEERIAAIRRRDPGAFRNFIPLDEIESRANESEGSKRAGDLRRR